MPRAMWSGSINFGLVSVPVKMVPATQSKDIHFHQIDEQSKSRIRYRTVSEAEEKEVPREKIAKGYELAPDQYVIIRNEEFESLEPEARRTIDITDFVDIEAIDPLYFDRPYYLLPDERAAKAYKLLVTAMTKTRKVGIATFVMRNKEYLVAIRPLNGVLCAETMRFADEVIPVESLEGLPRNVELGPKEEKMAEQLIEALSGEFEPHKYHDRYREQLQALIDRKAAGEEVLVQPSAPQPRGKVINLMAALEESLAKAGKKKPEPKRKRKTA